MSSTLASQTETMSGFRNWRGELAQAGARVILVNTIASVRAAQNLNPPVGCRHARDQ